MWPNTTAVDDPYHGSISEKELISKQSAETRALYASSAFRRVFPAGSIVSGPAASPSFIYILRTGIASFQSGDEETVSEIRHQVSANRLYGVIEAFTRCEIEPQIVAVTECSFDLISQSDFIALANDDPKLCFRLIVILGHMYNDVVRSIKACVEPLNSSTN